MPLTGSFKETCSLLSRGLAQTFSFKFQHFCTILCFFPTGFKIGHSAEACHCSTVIPNQCLCNRPTRQFKGVLTSLGKLIGHALPKLTAPLGVCLSNWAQGAGELQGTYRGQYMENINWFSNTSLFHPQGNKGDFVRGCISSVFAALRHATVPATQLLDIDCTHQTDQSRQTVPPLYLMDLVR